MFSSLFTYCRKKAQTESEILSNQSRGQGESSGSSSSIPRPGPSAQKKLDFLPTYEQINNESTMPSAAVNESIMIMSYPFEHFENGDFAELVFCVICLGVPSDPCISTCNHIFCKNCISHWGANSGVPPLSRLPRCGIRHWSLEITSITALVSSEN